MKQIQKVAFPENLRLMSLEVTELQGGGTRGRQILYFCNLEAYQPEIFWKCYFLYLFHITEKDFFLKKYSEAVM